MNRSQARGGQNEAKAKDRQKTKKISRERFVQPKPKAAQTSEKDAGNNAKFLYLFDISRVRAHFASLSFLSKVVVLP